MRRVHEAPGLPVEIPDEVRELEQERPEEPDDAAR
jgi:hypothetical protein